MINDLFRRFAAKLSTLAGSAKAFMLAVTIVLLWALTGPTLGFSDTWQLIINTFTTLITFLMVFLIQNAQNRETRAVHLKLDELLRAVRGARSSLINIEELGDDELETLHVQFKDLHERSWQALQNRRQKLELSGQQEPRLTNEKKRVLPTAKKEHGLQDLTVRLGAPLGFIIRRAFK